MMLRHTREKTSDERDSIGYGEYPKSIERLPPAKSATTIESGAEELSAAPSSAQFEEYASLPEGEAHGRPSSL